MNRFLGGGGANRLFVILAIGIGGLLGLGLIGLGVGMVTGAFGRATATPTLVMPAPTPLTLPSPTTEPTVTLEPSVTPTLVMPSPILATATLTRTRTPTRRVTPTPTLVYTTTVRSWVAAWLAGTIAPLGFNWEEHLTDGVQASEVSLAVIAWLLPKNRQPPVSWRALTEAEVAALVTPNLPDWMRNYRPPADKKLIWLIYPTPPDGEHLINVPKYAAGGQEWPKSSDLIRAGKVVFGLEPLKEEGGLGCGNPKLLFPKPAATPTPTLVYPPTGGPTSPPPSQTRPPGPTNTPRPPPSQTLPPATGTQPPGPTATRTVFVASPTPMGQVICPNPPCSAVPTNTTAPVLPTALPPANPTAVPPTSVAPTQPPPTAVPPTPPPQPTPTAAPR